MYYRKSVKTLNYVHTLLVRILVVGIVLAGTSFNTPAGERLQDDLFSVTFPTKEDGWACGRWGCVLHTADGGKTWERQQGGTDYTLSSIFFVDANTGWAVGDGGTIIHTTDGGKVWKKQTGPEVTVEAGLRWGANNEAPEEETKALDFFLMGVYFVNSRKGWIATERTTILSTENGGKTWEIQFSDEDFILKSISFCDDLNGWAVGEFGYIYHTEDGGQTWQHQAGYFDISDETGEMIGGNFLFDVVALNPRTAWAVGIDGYVVRTVDGGKTWQAVETGIPRTQLFCIQANYNQPFFIGGTGIFFSSNDQGVTWKSASFDPPITYGWIYDISPRGANGFASVGKEGWVYLTDDQGVSWRRGDN
jgi:photosystem II stability/assembly factor-like uncharacterized protein